MLAKRKQLKSASRIKDPRHERRKSSRRVTTNHKKTEKTLVRAMSFEGMNMSFRRPLTSIEPKTAEDAEFTTRLQFHRRKDHSDHLLVIIVFEGVIGDTFKKNLWSEDPPRLHLRPNAIHSLKKLAEHFQLALILLSDKTDFAKFDSLCSQEDFSFDAVYRSSNTARWESRLAKETVVGGRERQRVRSLEYTGHVQDYSQVYLDFGITCDVLCKVLILASIAVDPEELSSKTNADVLYWNGPFETKKFLV